MINNFCFESINPISLGENDLLEIAKVEKDIWAYGIGEYVKCNCCNEIYSKNDIFGHLSANLRIESVTKLEEILCLDSIKCKKCNSDTIFIYDIFNNVEEIKKRLFNSKISFLSLLKDSENGDIKGFMDGYVDNFYNIYDREFKSHYGTQGFDYLNDAFELCFGENIPEELFTISSLGTYENTKSINNLLTLIRELLFSVPEKYFDYTCIAEFDTGSIIHSFFHAMGFKKLEIEDVKNLSLINKSNTYNSDLYYWNSMIRNYRTSFSMPVKKFIKSYKYKMKEVLLA